MTSDLRARVLAAIDEKLAWIDFHDSARTPLSSLESGAREGWPAALRFARGEVERHGIDTDYPDCYCCESRYPCPSILAAAQAFGVRS